MSKNEMEVALERLASRSEALADNVARLSRQSSGLRREVGEALRDIDNVLSGATNA
jgi:chaperonin cofactor prefoldin